MTDPSAIKNVRQLREEDANLGSHVPGFVSSPEGSSAPSPSARESAGEVLVRHATPNVTPSARESAPSQDAIFLPKLTEIASVRDPYRSINVDESFPNLVQARDAGGRQVSERKGSRGSRSPNMRRMVGRSFGMAGMVR